MMLRGAAIFCVVTVPLFSPLCAAVLSTKQIRVCTQHTYKAVWACACCRRSRWQRTWYKVYSLVLPFRLNGVHCWPAAALPTLLLRAERTATTSHTFVRGVDAWVSVAAWRSAAFLWSSTSSGDVGIEHCSAVDSALAKAAYMLPKRIRYIKLYYVHL